MGIEVIGEDKRPQIICPHCKNKVILSIAMFERDATRIAEYTCHRCQGKFYGGIIIIVNTRPDLLFQNIQQIVDAVGAKNTLRQGDPGQNIALKH